MPEIFISYARSDSEVAQAVYRALKDRGLDAWLDTEDLEPGVRWKSSIHRQIHSSNYFIALLSSSSVNRKGYVQKELRQAIDILEEFPEDEIFLIPIRLDECRPSHPLLAELNWLDLFPDRELGLQKLCHFLEGKLGDRPQEVSEISVQGRWIDPTDNDTVFFKQSGMRAVGFYDYGRGEKVGLYLGEFAGRSFEYRWKWLDKNLDGHGKMTLSDDGKDLSGSWWYRSNPDSVDHVGYSFVSDEMPSWLADEDFLKNRDILGYLKL